jgi:tetrahydromethanopterin S-methyltransferase subunit G
MDQTQDNWTEKRLDRLEKRTDDRFLQLERRNDKRVDGVYSTILWTMLVVFAVVYVAALVAASAHG